MLHFVRHSLWAAILVVAALSQASADDAQPHRIKVFMAPG